MHPMLTFSPSPAIAATTHVVASAACYCLRRGVLHELGAREVARRHCTFESGWPPGPRGVAGFALSVAAWLLLYLPVYPLLEPALRVKGIASFYYYYPNANGAGVLFERLSDRKQVLRLDWHRFQINVGKSGRKYAHGGVSRHPPAVLLNLPHIDLPTLGVRHWPWRQYTAVLLPHALQNSGPADSAS